MSNRTIDVDLINAFWQAIRDVLATMGGLQVLRRRVFLRPDNTMYGDHYAVIGLTGGLTGSVALCFRSPLARRVVASLFGEEIEDEELLVDGIGELCNLTAGGGKAQVAKIDYDFEISPPTTLSNHDQAALEIHNPAGTVCVVVECGLADCDDTFTIEISLETQERSVVVRRKHERAAFGTG